MEHQICADPTFSFPTAQPPGPALGNRRGLFLAHFLWLAPTETGLRHLLADHLGRSAVARQEGKLGYAGDVVKKPENICPLQ